jgi:hypothetical protein
VLHLIEEIEEEEIEEVEEVVGIQLLVQSRCL